MRLNRASCLMLTLAAAAAVAEDNDTPEECGIYLAVSSTSTVEEPKWGLYAGKEYPKGVPVGAGEVAIQTFHLMANSATDDEDDDNDDAELVEVVEFFEQFIWVPNSSGGQFELHDGGRTVTAIPGAGVLGGYNVKLSNTDWNHSSAFLREAWNEEKGVAHPGRGAYSNFFDVSLRSTQTIPAGMEIFVNYGDNWEDNDGDDDDEKAGYITREDHTKVDETVDKMIEFFDKHGENLDADSKQEIYNFLIRDVMSAAAGMRKGAKIATMLPDTPDKLLEVKAAGGSLKLAEPTAVRSLQWLQDHGRCMDNIQAGPSTIPHAGRGALASRAIAAGSLVAPVPLVQIVNERILDLHNVKRVTDEDDEEFFVRQDSDVTGQQLLANYCYGHKDSRMQFFPAGSVVALINHSNEPNAKMKWSEHPNHHSHWFDIEPESLIEEGNQHLGLLMEIVAIKDISEGEEVTIDYGSEWQAAWDEHVNEWEALVKNGVLPSPWPVRALDLNQEYRTKPFEITSADTVYPDNVMLKCFLMVGKPENEPLVNEKGEKIRVWSDAEQDQPTPTMSSENLFDCTVVDREETNSGWTYTISWSSERETTLVKKVAHKAIVFVDKPGTSDQFVGQSFRHYIGIPDEIFPEGPWRNAE